MRAFLVAGLLAVAAALPPFPPSVAQYMNLSADPCNDFYEYACGGWIAKTVLTPTEDVVYKSISTIEASNTAILNTIIQDNNYAKLKPLFDNCVDRATINSLGVAPLQPYRFLQIQTLEDVAGAVGTLTSEGMSPLFTFSAVIDAMDPSTMIAEFDQGGFTLPSRDMYLTPSQLLTDYQAFVTKMFVLLGDSASTAATKAQGVINVETQLAKLALPDDQIRDPASTYHRSNLSALIELAPNFNWGIFFESTGINVIKTINVAEPTVIQAVDSYLATAPIAELSAYVDWTLLYNVASNYLLPDVFVNETFAFNQKLTGETALEPLADRCVDLTNNFLGDLVSQYFLAIAFAGNSSTVANGMVDTIISTFLAGLQNVSWMDAPTKAAAVAKENLLAHRVGAPSNPNTYSDYTVTPGQHLVTILNFQTTLFTDSVVNQLGKPSNRNAWSMFADTVNAYYDPHTNSLSIPAGILQYPYFSSANDPALNFAGAGVIVGHENSHGFDDQGSQFDGTGLLKNWWSPSSLANFQEKTACMIKQYSQYEVLPGVYVNGNLTIGENIADNGGVKTSYNAYMNTVPSPNPALFFVAYAQGWCSVATPQFLEEQVQVDVHSPAKFRAIGPLQNRPEFASTFSCPAGSAMNPSTKCEVW